MNIKNIVIYTLVFSVIFLDGCATMQRKIETVSNQCNVDCQESYIIIDQICRCIDSTRDEARSKND